MRRTIAASFGKMPTTSVRRLISALRHSSGLVDPKQRQSRAISIGVVVHRYRSEFVPIFGETQKEAGVAFGC